MFRKKKRNDVPRGDPWESECENTAINKHRWLSLCCQACSRASNKAQIKFYYLKVVITSTIRYNSTALNNIRAAGVGALLLKHHTMLPNALTGLFFHVWIFIMAAIMLCFIATVETYCGFSFSFFSPDNRVLLLCFFFSKAFCFGFPIASLNWMYSSLNLTRNCWITE